MHILVPKFSLFTIKHKLNDDQFSGIIQNLEHTNLDKSYFYFKTKKNY